MDHFVAIDPRNPVMPSPDTTLGIEITIPEIAARCGLGNIDPQHGCHRPSAIVGRGLSAAVDSAAYLDGLMAWPPDGATLATVRPDVDSIGAMAVIVLRRLGLAGYEAEHEGRNWADVERRIRQIAAADGFAAGPWPGVRPLPTATHPWGEGAAAVSETESLAPLAVICSPAPGQMALPLSDRVAVAACWLMFGDGQWDPAVVAKIRAVTGATGEPVIQLSDAAGSARRGRNDMVRALSDGRIAIRVALSGPPRGGSYYEGSGVVISMHEYENDFSYTGEHALAAVVESAHIGALGLGYCIAPVVVAAMPPDASEARKVTIAAWDDARIDRDALLADLNAAEQKGLDAGLAVAVGGNYEQQARRALDAFDRGAKWGGGRTILGSPQGAGTLVPLNTIAGLVVRHLRAWKGRRS